MRLILRTFLLVILFNKLFAQNFGIQLLAGNDFYKINSLTKEFNLFDLTKAKVVRDEFKNPLSGEVNLFYETINWGTSFSIDAAYTTYNVSYSRNYPQPLDPFYIKTSKYKIDFARATLSMNYFWKFNFLRNMNILVGGGPAFFITAPVVSDKFIYDTIKDKMSELDFSSDIKIKNSLGAVIFSGMKFKLFNHFGLMTSIKYLMTSKGKYEEPYNFIAIHSGMSINF